MNLLDDLVDGDDGRVLVESAQGVLTIGNVRGLRAAGASPLATLHGRAVALAVRNPRLLAMSLLLLDGRCEALVLLPADLRPDLRTDFMAQVGAECCLTDADLESALPASDVAKASLPLFCTRWFMPTSGTSGDARLVEHSMASLSRSVRREPARGAGLRWGLLYDLCRFAGLQVFLQSLAGGSVLVVDESAEATPQSRIAGFVRLGVNALSATPTLWRQVLMSATAAALEPRLVTLGGEIATQDVLDALAARWPSARITHIYASTEAGVGFAVADRIEGFPADWLADPLRGISVDPVSGEMLLRVPAPADRGAQTVHTGDAIEVLDGRARFRGRLNGSINVGGNKVMPEEVERAILAFPGVAAAAVKGRRSSLTGALVVADVVLWPAAGAAAEVRGALLAHCRARLEPYKVPALLNFVDNIETGSHGKALRN